MNQPELPTETPQPENPTIPVVEDSEFKDEEQTSYFPVSEGKFLTLYVRCFLVL